MNDISTERLRVAFIDDSEDMRILALSLLGELGLDVLVAERESLQVEELARWRPDLVVVDPHGVADATRSPFAVLLAMRETAALRHTPVVLVADSWTLWQYEADVIEVSPLAVLHKPLSVAELIEVMHGFMRVTGSSPSEESGAGAGDWRDGSVEHRR